MQFETSCPSLSQQRSEPNKSKSALTGPESIFRFPKEHFKPSNLLFKDGSKLFFRKAGQNSIGSLGNVKGLGLGGRDSGFLFLFKFGFSPNLTQTSPLVCFLFIWGGCVLSWFCLVLEGVVCFCLFGVCLFYCLFGFFVCLKEGKMYIWKRGRKLEADAAWSGGFPLSGTFSFFLTKNIFTHYRKNREDSVIIH